MLAVKSTIQVTLHAILSARVLINYGIEVQKLAGVRHSSALLLLMASNVAYRGDPLMTTFDGRTFQFMGDVGSCYNIISEKTHQVNALWPLHKG